MSSSASPVPSSFQSRLCAARKLYSDGDPKAAAAAFEELLPEAANNGEDDDAEGEDSSKPESAAGRGGRSTRNVAEIHLSLAKCHKSLDDVRSAVASCNAAVSLSPKWKDPFLYRSACFQALHQSLVETDGDSEENVARDRAEANIIVDPEERSAAPEGHEGKTRVASVDEALQGSREGDRIFVEKGEYYVSSSPLFICGKSVSLIGASTRDCVFNYTSPAAAGSDASSPSSALASRLNTFLICAGEAAPVLLKRLTFRNVCTSASTKTRFLGVAGGTVQVEDCVFEGADGGSGDDGEAGAAGDVDAIYADARIAGALAVNYATPKVHARFCVFDHCQSYAAFTVNNASAVAESCYFVGSRLSAMEKSRVAVENCEFAQSGSGERTMVQSIGASRAHIEVRGCYIHGIQTSLADAVSKAASTHAISISTGSNATVSGNYIYRTGNGIACHESDLECSRNLIINCTKRCSEVGLRNILPERALASLELDTALGHQTGISLRRRTSRMQVTENDVEKCDVGVYVGDSAMPTVKGNSIACSYFTGLFVECKARPNVIGNSLVGRGSWAEKLQNPPTEVESGLGMLFVLDSAGLVGKNRFENFDLSPLMVFASCRPVLKSNTFVRVSVNRTRQEEREGKMRELFCADNFKRDTYFYIVDSEERENSLRETILAGQEDDNCETKERKK